MPSEWSSSGQKTGWWSFSSRQTDRQRVPPFDAKTPKVIVIIASIICWWLFNFQEDDEEEEAEERRRWSWTALWSNDYAMMEMLINSSSIMQKRRGRGRDARQGIIIIIRNVLNGRRWGILNGVSFLSFSDLNKMWLSKVSPRTQRRGDRMALCFRTFRLFIGAL